jgi:type IV pilus assembly protein PilP
MKKVILLTTILGLFVSCEGKKAPAPAQKEKVSSEVQTTAGVKESEVVETPPAYRYEPFGKTDPFEPIFRGVKEGGPELKTPLEEYNVTQFELVGIIWDVKEPKAVVKDPKGETYIVGKGTRIGRNNGKITKITEKKVYIVEEYEDIYGQITTGEVVLEMKE